MKIKFKHILIISIICCVFFVSKVSAATITAETMRMDGIKIVKWYTNATVRGGKAGADPYASGRGSEYEIMYIDGQIAYCLELLVPLKTGVANTQTNMYSFFRNGLNHEQATALVSKITLYIRYGNQLANSNSGNQMKKYVLATQQLIWQAISDSGFYDSYWYYERAWAGVVIRDYRWAYYSGNDTVEGTRIDLSREINNINTAIANRYKLPSMCSGTEQLNIEPGETVKYTDNNNVLRSYNVSCSGGITCSVSGNTLTVKANYNNGDQLVKFTTKNVTDINHIYTYKIDPVYTGGQALAHDQGILEGTSCEMGPVKINNCSYRYEYKSSRTISADLYDMKNNLIATESSASNTLILAGTYVGLNITEVQKAEVIVRDSTIKVTGNVSFADCRKAAIADALKKAGATQDGVLKWGPAYVVTLPDSNDADVSSTITINTSAANKKNCFVGDPSTGDQSLDSDCQFDYANTTYIQKIVNNASNGVNTATMYINYEYKKLKTCINVKTGDVRYLTSSNSNCSSNELEVEKDTVNGQEHWHYFIPLNTKSNKKLYLKVNVTNLRKNDTSGGNVSIRIPIEQKFYNEGMYNNTIRFQGFNFYYKPIDIENPFPNISQTSLCRNGMPYVSLWSDWLLAKCTNKTIAPDLSKSFAAVTYIAANIDAAKVRAFNATNPYTSWSNMTVAGASNYIGTSNGVIIRNGKPTVYKLGCGPANNVQYRTSTKVEDPLYIKGCA